VQVFAGTQDQSTLLRYRIANRALEEVAHGGIPGVHRMGSWLVWPQREAAGKPSTLRAISFDTGQPVQLPAPLTGIRDPSYLAFSDDTAAWVDKDLLRLSVWHTGWEEPVFIVAARREDSEYLQFPDIASEIITWSNNNAQFALDLRGGSYTQITPEFGSTTAHGGPYLIIGFAPDLSQGKENARSQKTVIDTRTLPPLPGCG
jgi:hypothetical protein